MTITRRIGYTLTLTVMGLMALWLMVQPSSIALSQTEDPEDEEPVDVCAVDGAVNLLSNPSFEGEYGSYVPPNGHPDCSAGVCTTAQIPKEGNWVPYWRSHDDADPGHIIRMPEYKPACIGDEPCPFPERLRDGGEALQYFSFFSTHEAGIMQQAAVTEGSTYCFSAWGHSWHSDSSTPAISDDPGAFLWQKVGIDPTGGTDFTSPNVIWSDQDSHPNGRSQFDEYGLFHITATAQAPTVTVFVYSQPQYAKKHNDVYWDDTRLTEVEAAPTAPISTTIELNGRTDITVLTSVTDTAQITEVIEISTVSASEIPTLTWQATITNSNLLTPTLSATSGTITEPLTITASSEGLPVGTYQAEIAIRTNPPSENEPLLIPIKFVVAQEIFDLYASMISTE